MRKINFIVLVVVGMLGMHSAQAQEKLTLQEAIQYALQNKVEAQKAKLEIENAEHKIAETRAGALPQISASGGVTYNPILQQNALDFSAFPGSTPDEGEGGVPGEGLVLVAFGTAWTSNNMLSLNQQVFNQALFTGLKAARSTQEFYRINNTLTEEQLIEKIANAYYQVFQTQQNLATVQTNLDNTKKTRDIIKGLYEAGLQKKIDLDRIEVSVNNLESQRQQTLNGLELQRNALKFAMGMEMSRDIVLPEETFEVNLEPIYSGVGAENRTEIQLMDKQAELLEFNKKAIEAEYYPTVSIGANYGFLGFSNSFFLTQPGQSRWADFAAVSLNVSIPIFNGFSTRSKVRQATVELERLRLDRIDTKLALDLERENARAQMKNSLLVIQSNEENVRLAKDVLDNTENNYRNGLANLTELLDAERAYAEAQNNYTTSLLNYKVAEVQLIKSRGELRTLINEQ